MDRAAEVARQGTNKRPSKAVVTLPNRATTREFVDRIRGLWRQGVENILEIGKLLLAAKAQTERADFEAMVHRELPFGPRAARSLMAIARHPSCARLVGCSAP